MTHTHERRLEIIAESDRRWPDYGDLTAFNLSGGFLDGGEHISKNPGDDRAPETIAEELYPDQDDETEQTVALKRRSGAVAGVKWAREQAWD